MIELLAQHDDTSPVAFGSLGVRTKADLLRDAAVIASFLPEPSESSRVLLVFESDRYAFVASLFACWLRGHTPDVPPDQRRSTLMRHRGAEEVVAVLHDTSSGIPHRVQTLLSGDTAISQAVPEASIPRLEDVRLWLHGERRSGESLSREVRGLATLLSPAPLVPGERFACTVPVGHAFGLVTGALLPLCSGGAFERSVDRNENAQAEATTLVTAPRHLEAFIDAGRRISRVYCGTSPWPRRGGELMNVSAEVALDLFATSHRGVIAWRPGGRTDPWTPLWPGAARCDEQGYLVVDGQPTADRAIMHADGCFEHLGRADDTWTVGDSVVSSRRLEAELETVPGVREAVVVPSSIERPGLALVGISGRDVDEAALDARLQEELEPEAFVLRRFGELPTDELGRVEQTSLRVAFGLGPDGSARATSLAWGETSEPEPGKFTLEATVPSNFRWFDGHFDGFAVLSAGIQLQTIVLEAVRRLGLAGNGVLRAERFKFSGRIGPGEKLQVIVEPASSGAITVSVVGEGGIVKTGGRLRWVEAGS